MPEEPAEDLVFVRHTTHESVVDHLRTLILRRHLKPGDRLVQSEVAEQLGVSRTPIREALQKLASEGFVTFSPYKGAYVAEFSLPELEEIYNVRIALEGYAAYLAAQCITEAELQRLEDLLHQMDEAVQQRDYSRLLELNHQFHSGIYAAANQGRLYELITSHMGLSDCYRRMFVSLEGRAEGSIGEHKELLAALRRHDSEATEHLTRIHLQQTATVLLKLLQMTQKGRVKGAL